MTLPPFRYDFEPHGPNHFHSPLTGERVAVDAPMAAAFERARSGRPIAEDREILAPLSEAEGVEVRRRAAFVARCSEDGAIVRRGILAPSLRRDARRLLAEPSRPGPPVGALLLPHGHPVKVWPVAAESLRRVPPQTRPDVLIIVGTSHLAPRVGISLRGLRTDLGDFPGALEFLPALENLPKEVVVDDWAFACEHSILMAALLPLLYFEDRGLKPTIVSVLAGKTEDAQILEETLEVLRKHAELYALKVVTIISGDLSHCGARYGDLRRGSRDEVLRQVAAEDRSVLKHFERMEDEHLAERIKGSTFCARSQLLSVARHFPHRSLDAHAVIPFLHNTVSLAEEWSARDWAYSVCAARLFAARDTLVQQCSRLRASDNGTSMLVFHRCDGSTYELTGATRASASHFLLPRSVGAKNTQNFSALCEELAWSSCGDLGRRGRERAESTVRTLLERVPRYARFPKSFARWEPTTKEDLHAAGLDVYLPEEVDAFRTNESEFFTRRSSGEASSLRTLERSAYFHARERRANLTGRMGSGRFARLNRPDNLAFEEEDRLQMLESRRALDIAPGLNPATIDQDRWRTVIEHLRKFCPDRLHADPHYLFGLSRALLLEKVELPPLILDVGHGYLLSHYRRSILQAFPGSRLHRRLHTSEVGTIALDCPLGTLHAVEANLLLEVQNGNGRHLRGEGDLLVTTLAETARPLVRYFIGDRVRLAASACKCGSPERTVTWLGRSQSPLLETAFDAWLAERELGFCQLELGQQNTLRTEFELRRNDLQSLEALVGGPIVHRVAPPLVEPRGKIRLVRSSPIP